MLIVAGCSTVPAAMSARSQADPFPHGAVASDHPVASEAGAAMLRRGGNAVDAAVATSFCLSVVRPYSCGIGGGGFMVIVAPADGGREPTRVAINYRETSPAGVGPDHYVGMPKEASRSGVHAVGVPGTVAGLLLALERYGSLPRAEVMAPAIRAAEQGFAADADHVAVVADVRKRLGGHPALEETGRFVWRRFCGEGRLRVGDTIRNREQARALRLIARDGARAFYEGPIAEAIVSVMQDGNGPMTAADLAAYRPAVVAPLVGRFGSREVVTMPPPSSGGVAMLQIMGLLERVGVHPGVDVSAADLGHDGVRYVHLVTEASKHAFADRSRWLADPAFVPVPVDDLLADGYLDDRASAISPAALPSASYGTIPPLPEDGGTSHLSVVDGDGMAVACTETINLAYGSLVAVPGFGFILNDEMDDFTTHTGEPNAFGLRQSDRNLPAPGKRPLSSMSPTIVLDDGRVEIVAGASGGPRIISGTAQVILGCLVFDLDPHEALAAPRFHHQWQPDTLLFEDGWTRVETIRGVEARGHETGRRKHVGKVQVVRVRPDGVHAASDPRKGGRPAGH